MLGYLSADIICFEKRTVFRERSSRKTVSFEEQIMSKDKYPSIFSQPNWGFCVYYPSVLKIGEYPWIFSSFSWGIFTHMTRLDQSGASENIWWIINTNNNYLKISFEILLPNQNTPMAIWQHTTHWNIPKGWIMTFYLPRSVLGPASNLPNFSSLWISWSWNSNLTALIGEGGLGDCTGGGVEDWVEGFDDDDDDDDDWFLCRATKERKHISSILPKF